MNTNIHTTLTVIIALLIGGISGYALHAQTSSQWAGNMMDVHSSHHHEGDGTSTEHGLVGDAGHMGDMNQMMNMIVQSEQAFLEKMIPHHQEAVDTAKEVIARGGTTSEIRALVEAIVVAQEAEIADMKSWYEAWYGEVYRADASYQPMMRDLDALSGAKLDRVFLEDMIMHHMGAIMMAQSVQPHIEHTEIETLTQAIVTTQSDEIQLMRRYLEDVR